MSLLLYSGVDLPMIMEIAGHSTTAITTGVYGHPLAKAVRAAATKLDDLLDGAAGLAP